MIGLTTSIPQRYEGRALVNLYQLRVKHGFAHPIEIWEAGEEISVEARSLLEKLSGVQFRNTLEFDDRIGEWRGFQIKGPAILHSKFEHCIWCDGDAELFQNPVKLLETEAYEQTGSYIFHDFAEWTFNSLQDIESPKFNSVGHFRARQEFLRDLFPKRPVAFPQEWSYIYEDVLPVEPVQEAFAETAVFAFDRGRHLDVAQTFYNMNYLHPYTYKRVHGDKELLWMSFLLHEKPFGIHPEYPTWNGGKPRQTLGGEPFYV